MDSGQGQCLKSKGSASGRGGWRWSPRWQSSPIVCDVRLSTTYKGDGGGGRGGGGEANGHVGATGHVGGGGGLQQVAKQFTRRILSAFGL
jgi:hypothetical protein